MKKLTSLICVFSFVATEAMAMLFVCGDNNQERKYSQIKDWYNSVYNRDTKLKTKPSKRDTILFGGNTTTHFDVDIDVNSMVIGSSAIAIFDKKKLTTKSFCITYPSYAPTSERPLLKLKGTSAKIGRFSTGESGQRQQKFGSVNFELEDSTLEMDSIDFGMGGASATLAPVNDQSGMYFRLKGKSMLNVKGSLMLDEFYFKKDARVEITLTEKDGFVPFASIENPDKSFIVLEANINSKLKKGDYPLFQDNGRRKNESQFRSIKINGQLYSVGDTITLGENVGKLIMECAGKDNRKNDLILRISK